MTTAHKTKAQIKRAVDLALVIARGDYAARLRRKGRTFTQRAQKQWLKREAWYQTALLLLDLIKSAESRLGKKGRNWTDNDTQSAFRMITEILLEFLQQKAKGRGAPKKLRGLIMSGMGKWPGARGRPPAWSEEDQQTLYRRVLLVKRIIWGVEEGFCAWQEARDYIEQHPEVMKDIEDISDAEALRCLYPKADIRNLCVRLSRFKKRMYVQKVGVIPA